MRRIGYIFLEALVVFAILVATTALYVWLWNGFSDIGTLVFLGCLPFHLFGAFKLVLWGRSRGLWNGFYHPVRPVQLATSGIDALRGALDEQGIKHTRTGPLLVEDNRTLSRLEPVHGRHGLVGWVSSDEASEVPRSATCKSAQQTRHWRL